MTTIVPVERHGANLSWNNSFYIKKAQQICQTKIAEQQSMTVGILCSGGCLDTIAAIRAGFLPIWASEIDSNQARMFEDLTGGASLGDTFGKKIRAASQVKYIKSGQPCVNYARSGDRSGSKGDTGWMFVHQAKVIIQKNPWSFCLEISDYATEVNKGFEVQELRDSLSKGYVLYEKLICVWWYGDSSNRKRWFMVGFNKHLGHAAHEFVWPLRVNFKDSLPTARSIAVNDNDVQPRYWRNNVIAADKQFNQNNQDCELILIHRLGWGMGHSRNPYPILSWDGLFNGQTTLNGGAQRPLLSWKPGTDIQWTRLTVPAETVRIASLSDDPSSGYQAWCNKFVADSFDADDWLRHCVNNGVPQRTSTAIDIQVMKVLKKAQFRHEHPTAKWASLAWEANVIRSTLFDTGANSTINFRDVEPFMINATESDSKIMVANKQQLAVGWDGELPMHVVNTIDDGDKPSVSISVQTTTADVSMELFSMDPMFREGWGCHLKPTDFEDGKCEIYKPASEGQRRISIPLRYNYEGNGGFWLDYVILRDCKPQHRIMLIRHGEDCLANGLKSSNTIPVLDEIRVMMAHLMANPAVKDIYVAQHDSDRTIRGVKMGLKSVKRKQTARCFHDDFGHLGAMPNCLICKLVKGAARRIYKTVDPHGETRPGFRFHMDTVTWSDRSEQGNKYMTVLRDEASDYFIVFCHYLRNDVLDLIAMWIVNTRKDPAYHDCRYKVISEIFLDNAGEWQLDCADWVAILKEHGVNPIYSCPDRKESAANAEKSVGIVEIVTKSLLMHNSLPPWWWQYCCVTAVWLLNRFPTAKLNNLSGDGDEIRPLELFSRFSYSRRQIDRELSYYVAPGTPCLVQTTAKGSVVGPKTRWGIAINMYREQVNFMCPYTHSNFRSKSFAAMKLQDGINYAKFLALPELESSRKAASIPADFNEKVVIQLPHADWFAEHQAKNRDSDANEAAHLGPVKEVVMAGAGDLQPPSITVRSSDIKLGGSVDVIDSGGDPISMEFIEDDIFGAQGCDSDELPDFTVKPRQHVDNGSQRKCYVDMRPSTKVQLAFDDIDAKRVEDLAVHTDGNMTFTRVCKIHDLPHEKHGLYRTWLMKTKGFPEHVVTITAYSKLKPGLVLPYHSGFTWRPLDSDGSRKKRRAAHLDRDLNEDAILDAVSWVEDTVKTQHDGVSKGGKFVFSIAKCKRVMVTSSQYRKMGSSQAKIKKSRTKAAAQGKDPNPLNTRDALLADDRQGWVSSMDEEFNGLVEMGVFDMGHTAQSLLDQGITSAPVPCAPYYTRRFNEEGVQTRRKVRIAIQGHPGNMQKGIHFNETFSATPKESTARFLCAMLVLLNLVRGAFDITKAFCWAELAPGDQIALKYPEGWKAFCDKTGEELFMILKKNLYGHPAAGRIFGKQRDTAMLTYFNKNGWECKRCVMDPCLFAVVKEYLGVICRAWVLVHVDDCEIVGSTQQIVTDIIQGCKEIFGKITEIDPEFMLGVRRRITHVMVDGVSTVQSVECDMIAFVEGMAASFSNHLPRKTLSEPVPPKLEISMSDKVSDEEAREVLAAGYQTAMGMLLWAARRCYPGSRLGVSLCCRVMSRPSWKAFHAAMHMIAWINQNKTVGIVFTAGVNWLPLGFVDASNKPDRHDGKCQYGYVIFWMGGPIIEISKKLKHIGLSSEHNEYMAMSFANQSIVWMRQLLHEMGLDEIIEKPTVLLADNRAANTLATEDIVTNGNQYMYLPYHYNKEVQLEGFSAVKWVITGQNISDLLTKAADRPTVQRLSPALTGYDTVLVQKLFLQHYEL